MMGLSEKQLYKKFSKTIDIPTIARIDVELIKDIQFYSRFLAIYVSKMKKDWVRIDEEMNGRSMKRAQINYELKMIEESSRQTDEINKHVEKHPERDFRINDGSCLSSKEVYNDKIQRKKKKRRKKRFRKLWGNCVPLSNFKGQLFIDREVVLDRRKKRYEEDNLLYFNYVKSKRENKIQVTIKDNSLKSCYMKPDERKQEDFGCERDARTFNQPPAVGESDGAAGHKNSITSRVGKQSSVAECTDFIMVGTTSSTFGNKPEC
jgi:hypothetical protein